ncbi:cellulose synthase [Tanacetum coccineum]
MVFTAVQCGFPRFYHLSDDEEEVLAVRTKKREPATKKKASKMFDESFFTSIFNGLPRDDFDDSSNLNNDDQDKLGDHWPIHDPNTKWKKIRPQLGERYEGPEQLKRALTYYALANGYNLYFEVNNPRRLVAKCSKDNQENKCPFRKKFSAMYNLGSLFWHAAKATYPARNWRVVPSGETRFEVRNGYEAFKVDERLRTCTCRAWQLTGIPCQHGLNGMDQWPATCYQKPLPPIIRRMPGRPAHKRKRDAFENDGNLTRLSLKGSRGWKDIARGGSTSARGGSTSARGGLTSARGGSTSARGGSTSARGGSTSARGGHPYAEVAQPLQEVWMEKLFRYHHLTVVGKAEKKLGLRTGKRKNDVRTRGIGDGSRSRMYPNGIRPIGYGVSWDPVDGETMLGDSMGIPRPAWPEGITPEDDEEPFHVEGRVSERLKHKSIKMKPGPGLIEDDAISIQ